MTFQKWHDANRDATLEQAWLAAKDDDVKHCEERAAELSEDGFHSEASIAEGLSRIISSTK